MAKLLKRLGANYTAKPRRPAKSKTKLHATPAPLQPPCTPGGLMYESRTEKPLAHAHFATRLAWHVAVAVGLLALSLAGGMFGYVQLERLAWLDAFLNAAMLLGGMGPVNPPLTPGGKLFAGLYALYAGLVFIVTAALIFTPVVHRVMHKLHWDEKL